MSNFGNHLDKMNENKCNCDNYKAYGSTLKGICAPMMPLDACINCSVSKQIDDMFSNGSHPTDNFNMSREDT